MPSKPGYEPLSQAKPSRHPEVAGYQPDPAAPSRVPHPVTADRNYGEPATGQDLEALGVRTVAIPRKAKVSPARRDAEHAGGVRRLVKWRTGSEGRISYLKRRYSWDRTRLDGRGGAAIWCAHGDFATTWSNQRPGQLTRPGTQYMPCRTSRPNSALRLSQVEVVRTIPIPISAWEHTARPRK